MILLIKIMNILLPLANYSTCKTFFCFQASFSQTNTKPQNMDFLFTTGDTVTFKFSRGELENDFDIRITITPVACM